MPPLAAPSRLRGIPSSAARGPCRLAVAVVPAAAAASQQRSIASSARLATSCATPRPTSSSPSSSSSFSPSTTAAASASASSISPLSLSRYKSALLPPSSRPRVSPSLPDTHMSFFKKLFFSSGPSDEAMAKASEKAQKLIDDNNVVVFSKSWCSFSRSTKKTLTDLGADYTVVELDQESDGDDLQDALHQISGQRTVPNVYISQKHVGGNSDVQTLKSSGKLSGLLKSAGAIAE